MSQQKILIERRNYNRWVANQTLEDYALRFTAKSARRWSLARVANTALGAISFLALEAIGGAITLHYGFYNAFIAIVVVSSIIFLSGIPISYYAARYGVDIDLLSRGAGFGYIGSTITSLIYASFTFIFFALEAAILSSALKLLFGLPLSVGYLVSSLVVIPLVTHGITFISRFQLWTQPIWIVLQLLPFAFILSHEWQAVLEWTQFVGVEHLETSRDLIGSNGASNHFNLIFFGAASGVLFSLVAQMGEQVDFLRFLPEPKKHQRWRWWLALSCAGPGWIVLGALKILAGSFLAVFAFNYGVAASMASDPTQMYLVAFSYLIDSPTAALALAGIFVIVCQIKINVTNAYAGSIAWSNFFSRITHSHPGRVVWLVFNVVIALTLMELGIYEALENILGIYSNVAVAWVGALVADLVINKPLGFSPKHIEFKRAHLYDINPVGLGSMIIASVLGIASYTGFFGEIARALAPYISLAVAFLTSPLIAWATGGRYYLARTADDLNHKKNRKASLGEAQQITIASDKSFTSSEPMLWSAGSSNADLKSHSNTKHSHVCAICQNEFETEDMAFCPAYDSVICSLCCSLDARCHDQCKEGARFAEQITNFVAMVLPRAVVAKMNPRLLQFTGLLFLISSILAVLFWMVYQQASIGDSQIRETVKAVLTQIFLILMIIVGVLMWLFVLANESRRLALEESQRQTQLLTKEIAAHEETDRALQLAKEHAEAANQAKSRYLTGISHELRSPLNTILGYAQLLEKDNQISNEQHHKVRLIRRGGEHLTDLIEGLLDISRIEAGRLELHRDQVAFQTLINELIEMFSLQAKAKGIHFEYIMRSHLPKWVIADEKHLRQILINLLSNAVKFTQEGSVTLAVRYRSQVAEFIISDTGVGIETHELDRIFRPFERIRKPGLPQLPGTGLGLTITKLLTEIMGGDIAVKSKPGKGSTFTLSLMLSSVFNPEAQPTPPRAIQSYVGKPKTVMVVDDDATHRGLISEILSPVGFLVLEATDAESCLQALNNVEVDLFLLDIFMPGPNGWDLAKRLREIEISAPIIMVSANAVEDTEKTRVKDTTIRSHNDYLIKPIRDAVLLDKVANALNLEWQYSPDTITKPIHGHEDNKLIPEEVFDQIEETESRELVAMAELGYVVGLEKILSRLQRDERKAAFVNRIRQHLENYQFSEIIALNEKLLKKRINS